MLLFLSLADLIEGIRISFHFYYSNSSWNIVDMKLVFKGKHTEEVSDQESLLNYLVLLWWLQNFDWCLVSEFGLDHIVQCVEVDAIMTLFHTSDIIYMWQVKYFLSVQANDVSFVQFQEALLFIDNDAFNFASEKEY